LQSCHFQALQVIAVLPFVTPYLPYRALRQKWWHKLFFQLNSFNIKHIAALSLLLQVIAVLPLDSLLFARFCIHFFSI
jgi:hypothetical protein